MIKRIVLSVFFTTWFAFSCSSLAQIASDNFENNNPGPAYNDGIQYNDNGGFGFGALTYLEGSNGGVFNANLDGARALGIFAGPGATDTQALGRTITSPVTTGTFSLSTSFNVSSVTGFSGFDLKDGLGGTLGAGQLLFIGLNAGTNNSFAITDATGTHQLTIGTTADLRFQNIDFSISFDTGLATYSLTATVRSNGQSGTISGSLIDTNGATAGTGSFSAVGFGNFNSGPNQDFIIDNLQITAIPEPSTIALIGLSGLILAAVVKRRL